MNRSQLIVLVFSLSLLGCSAPATTVPPSASVTPAAVRPTQTASAIRQESATVPGPTSTLRASPTHPAQAANWKFLRRLGEGVVSAVAWSLDESRMAIAGSLGIIIYDTQTQQKVQSPTTNAWIGSVAFSPNGKLLAAGSCRSGNCEQGEITLWDVATGKLVRALAGGKTNNVVEFSPDGRQLLSDNRTDTELWDTETGQRLQTFSGGFVAVSPDWRRLVLGSIGSATLWDLNANTRLPLPVESSDPIAAFSPDGTSLALNDIRGSIRLVDLATGRIAKSYDQNASVRQLRFSPDGKKLAASADRVWLWDLSKAQPQPAFGTRGAVFGLAFSTDGKWLATAGDNRGVQLWDVDTGQLVRELKGHRWPVGRIAFSPSGHLLMSADPWDKMIIWDVRTARALHTFRAYPSESVRTTFMPGGQRLITWEIDSSVRVWNTQTGALDSTLGALPTEPTSRFLPQVAVDPGGRLIASATGGESDIRLWDARTGQLMRTLKGHTGQVLSLIFTPDGTRLISTGMKQISGSGPAANSDVRLWDTGTGALLFTHQTSPWSVRLRSVTAQGWVVGTRAIPDSCGRGGQYQLAGWDWRTWLSSTNSVDPLWSTSYPGTEYLAANRDMSVVAIATQDRACLKGKGVAVLEAKTGAPLVTLAFEKFVTGLALRPDGEAIAVSLEDRTVDIWDVRSSKRTHSFTNPTAVLSLSYIPDGRLLVSGHEDGKVRVWDADSGVLTQTLEGHTGQVTYLQFGSDGRTLASAGTDGTVQLWEIE